MPLRTTPTMVSYWLSLSLLLVALPCLTWAWCPPINSRALECPPTTRNQMMMDRLSALPSPSSFSSSSSRKTTHIFQTAKHTDTNDRECVENALFDLQDTVNETTSSRRRSFLSLATAAAVGAASATVLPLVQASQAAVGSLPEYGDTNVVLHGLTVNVADKSQQEATIKFLTNAFDCEILRQRIRGPVQETWLGYGPEQFSIPSDFELPVSSLSKYGGHASIRIVYDERVAAPFYRIGDAAPGNNIAYLQLGVPTYRVSQMVANGGNVLDAYGYVNVVSPSGLPIRSIVGIAPDPIMFVAVNCANVAESKAYYEKLGFVEQEYPYARPNKGMGQFEPMQPAKSVYMAPSKNGMGILLLPNPNKRKKIVANPVLSSLDLVYTPANTAGTEGDADESSSLGVLLDPSGVPIKFQSVKDFSAEEQETR